MRNALFRETWTYDNLNRMSASPGHSYSNDILGNRTNRDYATQSSTAMRHDWDVLNRAINILGTSTGASYAYRADGQRVEKVEGATLLWTPTGSRGSGFYDTNYASNRPTSRYFYDGQMGFEDDYNPSGSVTLVNRYGLGARGIDRIERTEGSTTTYGYPLYDGHGNMRTTLARNGSGYTTGTFKTYDVWGSVRSGGDSDDPKQKYCANLGHVSDDESGLIYMRARYHEPSTGRFISQDAICDGPNWFVYCASNPVNAIDRSGTSAWNLTPDAFQSMIRTEWRYAIAHGFGFRPVAASFIFLWTAWITYDVVLTQWDKNIYKEVRMMHFIFSLASDLDATADRPVSLQESIRAFGVGYAASLQISVYILGLHSDF